MAGTVPKVRLSSSPPILSHVTQTMLRNVMSQLTLLNQYPSKEIPLFTDAQLDRVFSGYGSSPVSVAADPALIGVDLPSICISSLS
jgi:hypothetical protein